MSPVLLSVLCANAGEVKTTHMAVAAKVARNFREPLIFYPPNRLISGVNLFLVVPVTFLAELNFGVIFKIANETVTASNILLISNQIRVFQLGCIGCRAVICHCRPRFA
jgi:hypothetical protein